jgi:hypothetical protein
MMHSHSPFVSFVHLRGQQAAGRESGATGVARDSVQPQSPHWGVTVHTVTQTECSVSAQVLLVEAVQKEYCRAVSSGATTAKTVQHDQECKPKNFATRHNCRKKLLFRQPPKNFAESERTLQSPRRVP